MNIDQINIYYFHGFNGGESSSTFYRIRKVYPNTYLVKYNFIEYAEAYREIYDFLRQRELDDLNTVFIGSSLGGN